VVPLISMFEGGHRWIFTDLENGNTRIDHELEIRPKGIFKLRGPTLRRHGATTVKETAAALEAHLEPE
jgi:hypothetical protein